MELVRAVHEAAARRDTVAVLAPYDPEVEFDASQMPTSSVGPTVGRGHEGLRRWFREWYEAWENVEHDIEKLIDAGEFVIEVGTDRHRGRRSGVPTELRRAAVWTIRDGKIVRVVWYPTREEALAAVGLRA